MLQLGLGLGLGTRNGIFHTFLFCFVPSLNSLTTVGYLLEVFIRLWIPSMVRIFTSAWS